MVIVFTMLFVNFAFSSIDFSPLFSNNYPRFFKAVFQFSIKNFDFAITSFLYLKFNLLQRPLMSLLPKLCWFCL
jgi:hypothetical protein